MEGEKAASVESVHESQSLSAGEREYVDQRKKLILQSLNELGVNCTEDSVPNIALLGSGGGQRAAVGLLGALYQMEKEKLLDSMLYLGGVSGSTWSMALLYADPEWSKNVDEAIEKLMNSEVDWQEAQSWLFRRVKEEDFSLTDIWGLMTTTLIMKQLDLGNLSDGANNKTIDPYPLYCAIEKNSLTDGPIEGVWFEGTPHEAGFTELGLFVETSLLGSKFEGGELVERQPELDMIELQAPAIVKAINAAYLGFSRAVNRITSFGRSLFKRATSWFNPGSQADSEEQPEHESRSGKEKKRISLEWSQKLLSVVEGWCQSLSRWPLKEFFSAITDQVLPLVLKWEWGTTNNFLYKYKGAGVPEKLTSLENINLVDAGLMINIPFPSFVGDKRDIDLIIALEHSKTMFKSLTDARDYAAELKKPFPEIPEEILADESFPKACYVFEGEGKGPTIIYLPLFNSSNCKTQEEYDEKRMKFTTTQGPYDKEQTEVLLNLAKENISNSSQVVLEEIKKAVARRQNKQGESVQQ